MYKQITTSTGVAVFPYLTSPSTKFNPEGTYSVNLKLTPEDAKTLAKEIETAIADDVQVLAVQHKFNVNTVRRAAAPWGPSKDGKSIEFKIKNNKVCGSATKKFEFKPTLFDHNAKPWDLTIPIGMGSKLKVAFNPYVWYVKGELGVSLRLKACQVIENKDGASADNYGFAPTTPANALDANGIPVGFFDGPHAPDDAEAPSEDQDRAIGDKEFFSELSAMRAN